MAKTKHILLICLSFFAVASCLKDKTPRQDHIIRLKWNQSYAADSFENALIGLSWAYSHVGATQTSKLFNMPSSGNIITVNINELGFSSKAEDLLEQLHKHLIDSEEFALSSAIDMGRYVGLLIGASEHYYALTDMPLNITDLMSQYDLFPVRGIINNSAITPKHRILTFSGQFGLKQLFITEETDPITGQVLEFETVDLMANGQPRFGIFDVEGNRENAALAINSEAGKPAKCMWCHESGIQPLFAVQDDFVGYLEYVVLRDTLSHYRSQLQETQNTLTEGVIYSNTTEHIQMELLYISFMEPSAARLSREWNLSIDAVLTLLKDLPTHENEEFPFLGDLYDRNIIRDLAPYQSVPVSSKVREKAAIEVNYMGT